MLGRQGGPHRCLELLLRQYLEESDGRSLLLRGTDAVGTFRCALIRNSQDDDPGIAHELYRGLPTTSYVAYLAQVLLAWKEMARNPLFQLPHVPMGGVTEDRSSLHRVLEVPVALVQSMDSVMALDSLITAIGGARGILTLLGVRCTIGSTLVCPPTRAQCLEAFRRRQSDGSKSSVLTVGARQWTKHIQRSLDGWWGVNKGSEAAKNAAAERKVVELLDTTVWMNVHGLPNGPVVFEIRQDQGYATKATTVNTTLYRELTTKFKEFLPLDYHPDATFLENAVRANASRHERLEQELNSYKCSMIKESIRIGHNDLGEFYYRTGDLANSLRSYIQARDYCTTEKHIVDMCFNVIKVPSSWTLLRLMILPRLRSISRTTATHTTTSLSWSNPSAALRLASPIPRTTNVHLECYGIDAHGRVQAQTAATFGLVHFCSKKYHAAALKFVECQVDIGDKYNEVIHAEDVAVLGGLCAVATFSRAELKEHVVQNSSFKAYLELVPRLREFITAFYDGNYASSLNILADLTVHDMLLSTLSRCADFLGRTSLRWTYAVQKELQVHSTAIRIVLTKLAERVVALENRVDGTSAAMHAMETMLHSMTGQMLQLHGSMGEWHEPVQMIQTTLQALGDTCNKLDYATIAHTTQLERQADALQFLNTKLEDTTKSNATTTKHEIEVLVQKTDSFHGHVLQKIEETKSVFATKLEDVSKKVDVLDHDMQGMKETKPAPPPLPPVTVVIPEGTTKIPVELHAKRLAAGKPKEKSGAYTDLKQFRIPDEMHERLEHNLAALYSSDVDDMRRPAIPNVAKLPRDVPGGHNLRFASDVAIDPPTSATSMSYLRLRTQDDSVSASADMRNHMQSKFHALYAMARGKQDALHVIMNRHVETINLKLKQLKDQVHHLMPTAPPAQPAVALLLTGADAGTLDVSGSLFDMCIDGSSVPALRLALLELSRNLHVVRQTRKHMSPDMRRNLDKIVDVLNDAYHVLSSDASPSPAVCCSVTSREKPATAFARLKRYA
ncbi:hypothetical protein DYB32_003879 [Aphanomyces invadans]|uniref:26S proteasome regulatory subunit Rpn7 N-terminal domain-containing protein n=1 Tax=Aphanomyces invadans TaxID=157072 RepID=A0A418AZ51_9STRA|nr:hypothetical protein DYB32_003879 [Aphanomyces invadans]